MVLISWFAIWDITAKNYHRTNVYPCVYRVYVHIVLYVFLTVFKRCYFTRFPLHRHLPSRVANVGKSTADGFPKWRHIGKRRHCRRMCTKSILRNEFYRCPIEANNVIDITTVCFNQWLMFRIVIVCARIVSNWYRDKVFSFPGRTFVRRD